MDTFSVIIILLVGGIGTFYLINHLKFRKHRKRCEAYIQENLEIAYAESHLYSELIVAADKFPICRKCGNDHMQLWNLGPFEMEYRCTLCKKKYSGNVYLGSEKVNVMFCYVENLYLLLAEISSLRKKYGDSKLIHAWHQLTKLADFDYFNLRGGTPYVRAIYFLANGKLLSPVKKSRKIPQRIKDMVWQRDEGKCVECGTKENLEFDHIIPHSKGGANTYRNIQLLCSSCNKTKSSNIG